MDSNYYNQYINIQSLLLSFKIFSNQNTENPIPHTLFDNFKSELIVEHIELFGLWAYHPHHRHHHHLFFCLLRHLY